MKTIEEASRYLTPDAPESLKQIIAEGLTKAAENEQEIKANLLFIATQSSPHFFHQVEGFVGLREDDQDGDDDNDYLESSNTWELSYQSPPSTVRVLIHEGTDTKDILRLLKKIRRLIKSRPDLRDLSNKDKVWMM